MTLGELVDLIGVDALRYSLARYPADSPLTLDVERDHPGQQRQPRLLRAVRPRPALLDRCATRATSGIEPAATSSTRPCSTHEREGDLLRALAEFPRVVAGAAQLREPHRVARYLEDTAATFHSFYDVCRVLPQGDEEAERAAPRPAAARRRDPRPCSPTVSTCSGVTAPERM